jgi:phosphatidylethanolamine-binding protein (PEBP) family uncharacterized protein
MGTWVHWVIFDIPPSATMLGEGITREKDLPAEARRGSMTSAKSVTGGPARRAGRTGTSSSSTPWTPCSPSSRGSRRTSS